MTLEDIWKHKFEKEERAHAQTKKLLSHARHTVKSLKEENANLKQKYNTASKWAVRETTKNNELEEQIQHNKNKHKLDEIDEAIQKINLYD